MVRSWTNPRTGETWELEIEWAEGSPYGFSQGVKTRGKMTFRRGEEEFSSETIIPSWQLDGLPPELIRDLFDLVRKRCHFPRACPTSEVVFPTSLPHL